MSGIVSSVGKVFSTVGSAAARVGQAVMGVGSTVFTAGAASGAGSMASGGLSGFVNGLTGGGVLGNVLTGAIRQAGYGALIGGAVGAVTGQGFGKGALMGGLGGAITGGLSGSGLFSAAGQTPTAMAPAGVTDPMPTSAIAQGTSTIPGGGFDYPSWRVGQAAGGPAGTVYSPAAVAGAGAAQGGGGLFSSLFQGETGGGLLAGLGKGMSEYMIQRSKAEESQKDRKFLLDKQQTITDSYGVDPNVLAGNAYGPSGSNPATGGAPKPTRVRYQWVPSEGRVMPVSA